MSLFKRGRGGNGYEGGNGPVSCPPGIRPHTPDANDIYTLVAATVHGLNAADVSKEQRKTVKTTCLGIVYGLGMYVCMYVCMYVGWPTNTIF